MTMKQELETWVAALYHYDAQEFEEAIQCFQPIADTSRILFNCGVIRATLGEHESAIAYFKEATKLDRYLAVAYFQQGVSNFLIGEFEEALEDFNNALLYLRGNKYIDYDQLGLKYKLHSCEALFNRGLCYIYLQQTEAGMTDLEYAAKEKATPDHGVIDDAIRERAEGYTVFSIPVGVVYRPNEAKVKNVQARDYLGKARLVAQASDRDSAYRRQFTADSWVKDDRPPETISYAATHLIRSGLSRSRQQSEPPIHRNLFPPTPPPDAEPRPRRHSPESNYGRSQSTSRRPEPLNLGAAAFESARPKAARSASERPPERVPLGERRVSDSDTYKSERLFGALDHEGQQAEVAAQLQNSRTRTNFSRQLKTRRSELIQEEDEEDDRSIMSFPEVRDDDSRSIYSRSGGRGSRRAAMMTKIRLKIHYGDDTRYIIISPGAVFTDVKEQIAKKFAIAGSVKIKTRDEEGDMITMGDQDDLEMALAACKEEALREATDMGKVEIWVTAS